MNSLGIDLTGKTVLIRKEVLNEEFREGDRRFKVSGGFGAKPYTSGTALFGTWLVDGEECRMSGMDVEAVVEE
jgi:hypothetical protein